MKTWLKGLLIGLVLFGLTAGYAILKIKSVAAGYLYGYPLLMMDQSRLTFLGVDQQISKLNQFNHIQQFPDHSFRNVVRPNNDTLYSIAWLDLSDEPLILSVPDTQGRYYVMPLMDAWSNVFAMIGRRTTGSQAGDYAIVGPKWSAESKLELPASVTEIKSPTNMVWLIGRIQTNGNSDIAAVAKLQNEFSLTPLSLWGANSRLEATIASASNASENPLAMVESLQANDYFSMLAALLSQHASLEQDSAAVHNLSELGIAANRPYERLGLIDSWLFNAAIDITQQRLGDRIKDRSKLENGWAVHRSVIGNYGTDYAFRAGVAKVGLGALPPEEAAYPNIKVDSEGRPLTADKRYKIHFDKGQTPPVEAFWSLSMYNQQGFFTDNKLKRYSIGDRDTLQFNEDGSLDILIQATKPARGTSNWLPSQSLNFELTMRLYSPKQSFLSGDWKLPNVELQP